MKKAAFLTALMILTLGSLWVLQKLLMPKYQTDLIEGSMTREYYDETLDHDVLFVGDCELYENISPIKLWQDHGITSYIRGSAQQLVWQSYYLLEDALKYERPKVVVFNVLSLKYDKPQKEEYNRLTLDGMRWSGTKARAVKASMTENEDFADYLFPILRYHSRWSELTDEDFDYLFKREKVSHNGYYMRTDIRPEEEFPEPMALADKKLGSNAMSYLVKMNELCKENGIKLILVKAPILYPYWYPEWDEQIVEYAKQNGLSYYNFIPLRDEIGLDMTHDTYDGGLHLNLYGAEKFTAYIGDILLKEADLEDHRSDKKYSDVYEEKIKFYNKMIDDQKRIREETQ